MKADYKNWIPKGSIDAMKYSSYGSGIVFLGLAIYILIRKFTGQSYLVCLSILCIVFLPLAIIFYYFYKKFQYMHDEFSFEDPNSMSWNIINFTANSLKLKEGDRVLDVGCGSGALAINIAKKNPNCEVMGVDKWGSSYKSFSNNLCQKNADIEGVNNVSFVQGNATKLDFPDESFDAVTSNYVYHNIPGNRQKYLLETFRVLKKGGQFAIHDIFVYAKFGNIKKFKQKLLNMGFEKVEFVDSTRGKAIPYEKAKKTMLRGSKLLIGIK